MIIGGVDLGGRKVAISLWKDGELGSIQEIEVPRGTRAYELAQLAQWSWDRLKVTDLVVVEEPLIGRGVRASLMLAQTAGAVLAKLGETMSSTQAQFVEVATWKKQVVGKGNASKEEVKDWLQSTHPAYSVLCGGSQDKVDATCIGLYGVQLQHRAGELAEL